MLRTPSSHASSSAASPTVFASARRWLPAALAVLFASGCPSCIDLATPREYPCALDAGSATAQCPDGYRCGLESYCHAVDAGAPYACASDSDCEHGWRCAGAGSRCVDPASEQLETLGYGGPLTLADAWPKLPSAPVQSLSMGRPVTLDLPALPAPLQASSVAMEEPGGVELAVSLISQGVTGAVSTNLFPLPNVRGLAATGTGATVVLASKDVVRTELAFTPVPPPAFFQASFRTVPITGIPPALNITVTRGSTGEVALLNDPLTGSLTLLEADGGHSPLVTPAPLTAFVADEGTMAAVADGGRLFLRTNAVGSDWAQILHPELSPAQCGVGVSAQSDGGRITTVSLLGGNGDGPLTLLLGLIPRAADDGGVGNLAAWLETSTNKQPDGGCEDWSISLGPCRVCPPGSAVEALAGDRDRHELQAVCSASGAFGASRVFHTAMEADPATGALHCGSPVAFTDVRQSLLFDALAASPPGSGIVPLVGAHGQLWQASTDALEAATPLFLAELPDVVTYFTGITPSGVSHNRIAISRGTVYADETQAFVPIQQLALDGGPMPTGIVANNSDWVVADQGIADLSRNRALVAVVSSEVEAPRPPYNAVTVPLPDGGLELLYATFDSILAADVTAVAADPGGQPPAVLQIRSVPSPRLPILSLTASPDLGDGGALFSGYALTVNGAQRFVALAEDRWKVSEITIPEGAAQALWQDQGRVRLGYADGTVYSLPGLVKLAEPLLDGGAEVADYAQFCGRIHALTKAGLFRLDPGAGPEGTWTSLNAALPRDGGVDGLGRGRLFPVHTVVKTDGGIGPHDELLVGTVYGGLMDLVPAGGSCP